MSLSEVAAHESSPLLGSFEGESTPTLAPIAALPTDPEHGIAAFHGDRKNGGSPRRSMAVVFPIIAIGTFLAAADGTIALVSYATISSELDALNMASWIMTAYSLALSSTQPLFGKLCDIFGRKQCLLVTYSVLALGCLACGLAQSIEQIIVARVLQAIGGGGLGTVVSILLTGLVAPEDRGIWQGILNVVWALGAGFGAPIGGVMASSVGWRWSFFGQIPFCLLAILLASWYIDSDIGRRPADAAPAADVSLRAKLRRVDFFGAVSLVTTIASLMLALDRGSNVAWSAPETITAFVVSAIAACCFGVAESRLAREPILPFSVTLSPKLLPLFVPSFLCFFGLAGLEFVLPLYYQVKDSLTPRQASLYLLPAIITSVISAMTTGFWMRRTGKYYGAFLLALCAQAVGGIIAYLLSGTICEYTPGLVVAHAATELGVGNGVVSALLGVIDQTTPDTVAVVTASYHAFRSLGSVLGISVVSTVVQMYLRSMLRVELRRYDNLDVEAIVEEVRRTLESLDTLDPRIADIVRECYGRAIHKGTILIVVVAILAIFPALFIQGGRTRRRS